MPRLCTETMFEGTYFNYIVLFSALILGKGVLSDDGPLNLTPLVEKGETEKARNLSVVDPTLFAGVESHAAYFTVNNTGLWNLFFWFFPAQGLPLETTPWIIWLQGGPGSSSLVGLFTEIGPLQIINGTVEKMQITWNTNYSLLFIDNPVGTGFSYQESGYATDEDMVGTCLLSLLQQFLEVFPELRKAPLFLAGESYAGKYIPTLAHYIHHHKKESKRINLKGLSIGDGWIDPPTLLHFSEWALQVGFLDYDQAAHIHELEEHARQDWSKGDFEHFKQDVPLIYEWRKKYAPINIFNFLTPDSHRPVKEFVEFLNRPNIQTAIHVKKKINYIETNHTVMGYLLDDEYKTIKPWFEELLEYYPVLCYSGQLDMIVGPALAVHTYRSLNWSGKEKYLNATRHYILDQDDPDNVIAFIKAGGNLTDIMVRGAGHMVPTDQPRAMKQIIDKFISSNI